MQTVFSEITKQEVNSKPFTYIVRKGAIDQLLVDQLIREFPDLMVVSKGTELGDNKRFSLPAHDVALSDQVSQVWKDFILAHVTKECWQQIVGLFGDQIREKYPTLENRLGRKLEDARIGVRFKDDFDTADILLDAQICINSPVIEKASSVKIAHLDNEDKLFGGLLYLRSDNDDSKGGDLEISVFKGDKMRFHGSRLVETKYIDTAETVEYKKNTLVYFLNSTQSLHGVTKREPTPHSRLFMNLVAVVNSKLFDLKPYQYSSLQKLWRKFTDKFFNFLCAG